VSEELATVTWLHDAGDRAEPSDQAEPDRSAEPGGRTEVGPTVQDAVDAFLAAPRTNRSPHTRRAYGLTLQRVADQLGPRRLLADVADAEVSQVLATTWGAAAPSTWNRNRAATLSWLTWCRTKRQWSGPTVPADQERKKVTADNTRAVDNAVIDRQCSRRDVPLRERLLWRMLYETASRASAVLALNVEEMDFENRRAPAVVKGGDTEWITWGRGTALLLPRYLRSRTRGPLFLSDRKPGPARRATAPARDVCPETGRLRLGYDRARILAKRYWGIELHQLRHSSATHLAEHGVDVTVIRAKTHHKSLRSLGRYVRPGVVAAAAATELLAPPGRRG
jgi:site-specific recombinase XerD